MPRRPPKRGQGWMFCLFCRRGLIRGYRLATGELCCKDCWQARQVDDSDPDAA